MKRPGWVAPVPGFLVVFVVVFAVALAGFSAFFLPFPALYDTDSYYHLGVARAYARVGVIDELPWARLSLLHEGFGDKEFLFHLATAPFAAGPNPALGGRFALAFWNAVLAAVLAALGQQAAGRWGLALPLLVYLGSLDFFGRCVRLRPELLALVLLLLATALAGRGRYRLLGAVTFLFTLSYTAFQTLLVLCVAWCAERTWATRRFLPALLLYPLAGAGLGLVAHPHFPHNLVIWKVQNVDFFSQKAALDVGVEIEPHSTVEMLERNVVWALALAALALSGRRRGSREGASTDDVGRMARTFHIATAAFLGLYLLMGRFSLYAVPFAALSVLWELRRRGRVPGPTVALPVRGRLPSPLVAAVLAAAGLWTTGQLAAGLLGQAAPISREDEWAAFGRAVPAGATVAADWGSTHLYMFWAPQALYLNVLDPVFMARPYPRAHAALRAVLEGREPDVPHTLLAQLDSRFLALSRFSQPELLRRLAHDPRLTLRYEGWTLFYEALPARNGDFVLDWQVSANGEARGPYPRAERPDLGALEGFVDVDRIDPGAECLSFEHQLEAGEEGLVTWELAPWGPTVLWIDGRPAVATDATLGAVLGEGLHLPAALSPGVHRLTVRTCRGRGAERRAGFYLRRRAP